MSSWRMEAKNKFRSIKDFHVRLGKPENKILLQAFLRKEFQKMAAITFTEKIYCMMGSCAKNCTTNEVVLEFKSSHAEAKLVSVLGLTSLYMTKVISDKYRHVHYIFI